MEKQAYIAPISYTLRINYTQTYFLNDRWSEAPFQKREIVIYRGQIAVLLCDYWPEMGTVLATLDGKKVESLNISELQKVSSITDLLLNQSDERLRIELYKFFITNSEPQSAN